MTISMPATITYGKVVGRFIQGVDDSLDEDDLPDVVAIVGKITFMPKSRTMKEFDESYPPPTMIARPITTVSIGTDGLLTSPSGDVGVKLITGAYKVSYELQGVMIRPHEIVVLPEHDEVTPLDLTLTIPPGGLALSHSEYAELTARLSTLETSPLIRDAANSAIAAAEAAASADSAQDVAEGLDAAITAATAAATALAVASAASAQAIADGLDAGIIAATAAATALAEASAASAAVSASLVDAPADDVMAALLANPASATKTSLTFAYATRRVFDVKTYGAVGDGVTDDQPAIQAALAAANVAGGGTVYFPKAVYAIKAGLTVFTNTTLRGERGAVLLAVATFTGSTMATMASRTNVTVEGLTFDCGTTISTSALNFVTSTRTTVRDCIFQNATNSGATGVRLNGGTGAKIDNCRFDTLTRGIHGSNNAANWLTRVKVLDCYFTGMADGAVYVTGTEGSAASEDFHIDNCRAEAFRGTGTTRSGIYFTVGIGSTTKHRRTRITNCTLLGRYESFTAGTGNSDFLNFYDIVDGVVAGCAVEGGGDVGISLSRARRCTIKGNSSHHHQTFGLGLWDTSDCTVTGNVFYDNRQNFGFPSKAVTWVAATDTFTAVAHGYTDTQTITFPASSLPAGLVAWGTKYVRDATADTFKVASTSGGVANDITADGSGVFYAGGALRGAKTGILCRKDVGFTDNNVIAGNRCYDDQTVKTQEYGVSIEAGCVGNLVVGNALSGNLIGGYLDVGTGSVLANNS